MDDPGFVDADPWAWFERWWTDALALPVGEPTAVTLATADERGRPSARVVLLKHVDRRGFVVYTNLESRKGREATSNPWAALCFFWDALARQVRVRGAVERVGDDEADAYWRSRSRTSQLGAWASEQSRPLADRPTLLARVTELEARFPGEVPRPSHWSGLRIVPDEIEFWSGGAWRLHDRFLFTRDDDTWAAQRLNP